MPELNLEQILVNMMAEAVDAPPIEETLWRRLVPLCKEGDVAARKRLVLSSLRSNLAICAEFHRPGSGVIELLVVANDALLIAAAKYDESQHGLFPDYSRALIRRALGAAGTAE